jgi:pyruvate dehydrogenase E2 component (dihydrolipoamide acetyltransferase)
MSRQDVTVPDIGDFKDVEIVEVTVKVGDTVKAEAPLITLETDKAAMEVPSPSAGRVAEIAVRKGGRVSKGDLILVLDVDSVAAEPEATVEMPKPRAIAAEGGSVSAAPAAPVMQTIPVAVPDLGEFKDVEIVEVVVKVGDTVQAEAPLITLETDKAAMEVPAPFAGRVVEIAVRKGGRVSKGDLILTLETSTVPAPERKTASPGAASTASPQRQPAKGAGPAPGTTKASQAPPSLPPIDEHNFGRAHASPAIRKFARELGVNLAQVKGTGEKNRVLRDDVTAFVKAILTGQTAAPGGGLPKVPVVDFAQYGPVEIAVLSRVRKISGPRLQAAWLNIPHVTQHDEADITALEERRQKLKRKAEKAGVKITPLAFIIKACILALKEFPDFNASLTEDGTSLVLKKYYHVGFAADTPLGLVVPVIRDADRKDLFAIARDLGDLSAKARAAKLTADEMRGGTFTVSSLGGIGGTFFTPIVNAPEVAILGVGRSAFRPVWQEKAFVPRLILPLSLSYDHRVIDGATGVRFTSFLVSVLAVPARLEA